MAFRLTGTTEFLDQVAAEGKPDMAAPNPQIIAIRRQRIAQVRAALEAAKDLTAEFIGIEPIDEAISAALIACDETEDQVVGQSAECGHKRVGRPCPYCAKEV